MHRYVYAAVIGLVGAGIVHIAILLLLPSYTERDAWSRLAEVSDLYAVTSSDLLDAEKPLLRSADPFFRAAACRFDLGEGLVHVQAEGRVPFWSASVYDRNGQNVYSFNDHTQPGGALDFAVMTPVQVIEARKDLPGDLEGSVIVEAGIGQGIVVVRAFLPDSSWTSIVTSFLKDMSCAPVPL